MHLLGSDPEPELTWPPATSISFEKVTVTTYTALADNPLPQQAAWLGKLAWETV